MKQLFSLALAALILAACTDASSLPIIEPADPAAPDPAGEAQAAFTVGTLFELPMTCGGWRGYNTGDAYYEIVQTYPSDFGGLILKTDYAAMTQAPLCRVPGCTHDSEDCPAYLPGWYRTGIFVLDGRVYVHYEAYDAEFRQAQQSEEELETWLQSAGLSPEDEAARRAEHIQALQPSFIDVITEDGLRRERLFTQPDELDWDTTFRYCDGQALYGIEIGNSLTERGVRLDLTTGQIDYFDLLPRESIVGVEGSCFLTERIVADEPLLDTYDDLYFATFQNAEEEFDLLDPATGERRRLASVPHEGLWEISLVEYLHGKLYLERRIDTNLTRLDRYDPASDTTVTLMEYEMSRYTWGSNRSGNFMPVGRGAEQGYICLAAADGSGTLWQMDVETGELYEITQKLWYGGPDGDGSVHVVAQTGDGRWMVGVSVHEPVSYNSRRDYGLIDPAAFLRGEEGYDLVDMYSEK